MKKEDLKSIYGKSSQDFHNCVLKTLDSLDEKGKKSYKSKKNVRRITLIACAIALAMTMATVTVATGVFGLFGRQVGNYGANVKVENEETTTSAKPKYVKVILDNVPRGYQLMHEQIDFYYYCYQGDYDSGIWSFAVNVDDADEYEETKEYVVETTEEEYNGHKAIIYKIHPDENSDDYCYSAVVYFEDFGRVVTVNTTMTEGSSPSYEDITNIVKGLNLEDYPDYVEPKYEEDEYIDSTAEDTIVPTNFGEDLSLTSVTKDDGANFLVKVKSVEERTDAKGLEYNDFFHEVNANLYDQYFDADKNLITPYTRTDVYQGDGINTRDKSKKVKDDRHFYLVNVDITCLNKDIDDLTGEMLSTGVIKYIDGETTFSATGGEIRQIYTKGFEEKISLKKGKVKTITYGIIVDDDALDDTYLTVGVDYVTRDEVEKMILHDPTMYLISLREALNSD
ncbi:MAG: hypothetical protein ACI4HL_01010 [Ruminococcus sp.]